jgi:hypothetical protein
MNNSFKKLIVLFKTEISLLLFVRNLSHILQTGKILYYVPVVRKSKRDRKEDEPVFVILGILSKQMDDDNDDDFHGVTVLAV